MQQLGASVFHTVVRWQKLGEVENEYTLHISIVLSI